MLRKNYSAQGLNKRYGHPGTGKNFTSHKSSI